MYSLIAVYKGSTFVKFEFTALGLMRFSTNLNHSNVKRAITIIFHSVMSSLSGLTNDSLSLANTLLGIILNLYLTVRL